MNFKERSETVRVYVDGQIGKHQVNESPELNYYLNILKEENYEYYRIIKSEYIDKLPKDWYQSYYARSTYYRTKGKSMKRFIKLIESPCFHWNKKIIMLSLLWN